MSGALKIKILLCLCFIFLTSGVYGADWQYRFSPVIVGKVSENFTASLAYETRRDEDYEQFRKHTDIGLIYSGWDHRFDLGLNYRQIKQVTGSTWTKGERYYLNFIARQKAWDIGFSHRVRLEYNNLHNSLSDFGTARYQLSINPPFEFKPIREKRIFDDYNYKTYAKYEVSVNTLEDSISSQSFLVGLSLKLSDKVITNLFVQRKNYKSSADKLNSNILGLKLKLIY